MLQYYNKIIIKYRLMISNDIFLFKFVVRSPLINTDGLTLKVTIVYHKLINYIEILTFYI